MDLASCHGPGLKVGFRLRKFVRKKRNQAHGRPDVLIAGQWSSVFLVRADQVHEGWHSLKQTGEIHAARCRWLPQRLVQQRARVFAAS